MSRLNIPLKIYSDARVKALVRLLGDERKAIGLIVEFLFTAQRYWGEGRSLIPHEVFDLMDAEVLIQVGLAIKKEEGVYACGSKEHFEWYAACRESASKGGKKSAEVRRLKSGSAVPHNAKNSPKRALSGLREITEAETEADFDDYRSEKEANPSVPIPILTSKEVITGAAAPELPRPKPRTKKTPAEKTDNAKVWAAYSEAYKARHKVDLPTSAIGYSLCSQLVKHMGLDSALKAVRYFVECPNDYYAQRHHPLKLCVQDWQSIFTNMQKTVAIPNNYFDPARDLR